MLNVIQISTVIPPQKDGVGASAIKIHKLLKQNKVVSKILTTRFFSNHQDDEFFYYLDKWSYEYIDYKLKILKKQGAEIVIFHYPTPLLNRNVHIIDLIFSIIKNRYKLFLFLHEYAYYSWKGKILILLICLFSKKILTPDRVNFLLLSKIKILSRKINFLPIGSTFTDEEVNILKYNEVQIGDKLRVCYWGLIMKSKGLENLVIELEKMDNEFFEFSVIGDLPYNYKFEDIKIYEMIIHSERIKFYGFLENEELIKKLSEIDIVILPFEDGVTERRGSFMLSMQVGKVVITSRPKITIPDLIDKKNVLFFDNIKEIREILYKIFNSKETLKEISEEAKKWYNQHYNDKVFINRLINALK